MPFVTVSTFGAFQPFLRFYEMLADVLEFEWLIGRSFNPS